MPKMRKKRHFRKKASLENMPVVAAKKAYFTTVKPLQPNSFWTDLQNSQKSRYQTS
jgi:hypothetical protein